MPPATSTIANINATTGTDDLESALRSFRLMPQRLQKLSPGVIGLPHAEQYHKFFPFTHIWSAPA